MTDTAKLRELLERCLRSWGPFELEPRLAYDACRQMGSDVALSDAAILRSACRGSQDAASRLVSRILCVFRLATDEDPSGCGSEITWWPHGLCGQVDIQVKAAASVTSLATIASLCRALIHQAEGEGKR